jgi:predicted small secreted protein
MKRTFNYGIILGIAAIALLTSTILISCNKSANIEQKQFKTAIDIFSGIDSSQIVELKSTDNILKETVFLAKTAKDVESYMSQKYNINIREYLGNDDRKIVVTGLVYAYLETTAENKNTQIINQSQSLNDIVRQTNKMTPFESCLYGTLTSLIGIPQIKALVADFTAGAVATTIVGSLTTILSRSFAAFTVGIAVYTLGDCMDWW